MVTVPYRCERGHELELQVRDGSEAPAEMLCLHADCVEDLAAARRVWSAPAASFADGGTHSAWKRSGYRAAARTYLTADRKPTR